MKKRKKNKKLYLLLLLVLGISIGYAALASNLKINGNSKVKSATWDIHWESVKVKEGSVAADDDHKARITDAARTEVEYSVELTEPGDYYEFTVDAKNDGTIDAEVYSVESKYNDAVISDENKLPSYVSYSVSYEDGTPIEAGNALNHGQKQTYKVKILYRDDVDASELPQSNVTLDLKFKVEYRQKNKNSSSTNPTAINVISGDKDNLQPGDQIKIGETEEFYVIDTNSTTTTLLAKKNLLVGNIVENNTIVGDIPTTEAKYGLQSSEATGYNGTSNFKGNVTFYSGSTNNAGYWMNSDKSNILLKYSDNDSIYFDISRFLLRSDDTRVYPYVYDENCDIYQYVESYVSKLKTMGFSTNITGRLLSRSEAENASTITDSGKSIIYTDTITYFTGSANDDRTVNYIAVNTSNPYIIGIADSQSAGVRPVIVVKTSEIN